MRRVRSLPPVVSILAVCGLPCLVSGADCNGNGRDDALDLAPQNFGFIGPPYWQASDYAFGLVAADFDRDGKLDIAVNDGRAIVVLRNRDGSFEKTEELPAGGDLRSLAAADLDGDRDVELISADWLRSVLVWENRGDGSFEGYREIPVAVGPRSVAVADLDGDGRLDIAVSRSGGYDSASQSHIPSGVAVIWNRPDGFHDGDLVVEAHEPWNVGAADLDGDKDIDLVFTEYDPNGRPSIALNDGAGVFAAPKRLPAVGQYLSLLIEDFDGDERPEIAIGGYRDVQVMRGDPGGEWQVVSVLPGPADALAAGDVDGDGRRDLIVASSRDGIRVHRGTDAGFDAGPAGGPDATGISAGDFDGDGDLDVAGIRNTGTLFLLPNDGSGRLPIWPNYPASEDANSIALGDFDGDGDLDVATTGEDDPGITVLLNDGSGGLGIAQTYGPSDLREHKLVAADLNGDGLTDLAGGGAAIWYRPAGAGQGLGDPVRLIEAPSPWAPLAADLDRDGDIDIAAVTYWTADEARVTAIANDGRGGFSALATIEIPSSPGSLIAANLDGGGWFEIVLLPDARREIWVVPGGADRYLAPRRTELTVEGGGAVAVDLDRDGIDEIAVTSGHSDLAGGRVVILKGRGIDAGLETWRQVEIPGFSYSIAADDLDGDGDVDLVASSGPDRFVALLNSGRGNFWVPPPYLTAGYSVLVTGDMDGDKIPDVVAASEDQSAVAVHRNPVIPPSSKDLNWDGIPDECTRRAFHRGDANGDGKADISDAISLLGSLFLGGQEPGCLETADVDNDGARNITDAIYLLMWLFQGGRPPASPGPPGEPCGEDPDPLGSPGDLGCASYEAC